MSVFVCEREGVCVNCMLYIPNVYIIQYIRLYESLQLIKNFHGQMESLKARKRAESQRYIHVQYALLTQLSRIVIYTYCICDQFWVCQTMYALYIYSSTYCFALCVCPYIRLHLYTHPPLSPLLSLCLSVEEQMKV